MLIKFLLAFTYGLKNKFSFVRRTSCSALHTHTGIKYLDYVHRSYWSLPYSPKQRTDISYEADCYTENKIIGVKEYDGDEQDSNTSRENMTKKFWIARTFIRIPSKFWINRNFLVKFGHKIKCLITVNGCTRWDKMESKQCQKRAKQTIGQREDKNHITSNCRRTPLLQRDFQGINFCKIIHLSVRKIYYSFSKATCSSRLLKSE